MLLYPRFAAVMAERDLEYKDLAAAVGVSRTGLSAVLRGRMRPSEALKNRLSGALGVPVEELFQLSPEMAELVELARQRGLLDDPVLLLRASA